KKGRDKSRKQEIEIRVSNSAGSSRSTNHFRELGERQDNIGGQHGHHHLEIFPRLNVTAGASRDHCIRM
ncbi:hypothetical protein B0H19DRAFT_1142151, partial [Mycena capillaripes]